jgi:hypothetical protein
LIDPDQLPFASLLAVTSPIAAVMTMVIGTTSINSFLADRRWEAKVLKLPNMDHVNKDIMLGLVVSALVAVLFLLVGIYIVGASPI